MPTRKSPRKGSLQFWPRKRASKFLPSVNWNAIDSEDIKKLKGFICYKCGMASAKILDNTEDSMTKGKERIIPITILECPPMKIFSIRFYKNKKVALDIVSENLEKEIKRKIKSPKNIKKKLDEVNLKNYDDIKIIAYSLVKKTNIKKTPDLVEIGLAGSLDEKMSFVKENLTKEISVLDFFEKGQLIDIRGLTKGKGFQGPVKRFGIKLRQSKSEKGIRKVGSIGPWHPARVTFRVPMAGQLGMFTRVIYNNKIIDLGKSDGKLKNIKNYGDIKTNYIIVNGSVQGTSKRQLIITHSLRKTKKQLKKEYELKKII
ncbi:50S ribosomal protein L3 [Candidatus Pacearchaeota archaeon]|nr:MAG: 50S ribosomal protein L3 [Candidatus Pacearchaeota archaeon]